ncbi:MAG: DNA mismatch endonuclease Vsr [Kiritimatiellae bacterium]|nr:DNA mismatch endonuclease Vsr [Kiritimatiellia bacterium]
MPDSLTPEARSRNMARIRSGNTKPERALRSLLHRAGFRFTVNGPLNKTLPGKPDLVLPKHHTVIFVHGCFWHQHPGCKAARIPKSSSTSIDWKAKLEGNAKRDRRNARELRKQGWKVLTVWECRLKDRPSTELNRLIRQLNG